MNRWARGLVMTETAVMMAVVLLILFGGVEMAVIGYMQSAADGASFVAAHAVAVNSSANGPSVAQTPFPIVGTSVTMATPAGAVSASTSLTTPGLLMMGNLPATYNVYGGDVEPAFGGGTGGTNGTFAYNAGFGLAGTNTSLKDYCDLTHTCGATYNAYLAQRLDSTGNGLNGTYKEWTCHLNVYQSVDSYLPATGSSVGTVGTKGFIPSAGVTGVAGTVYDWTKAGTGKNPNYENQVYTADNGNKNSGMNC